MSWQAMTAVSHDSKLPADLFRLLLNLAENARADGTIDPAPNQETLAAFFGCDVKTIRNRINRICASGELTQTRVGKGPGNASAYKINLPMPTANGHIPAKPETPHSEDAGLAAEVKLLKAEIAGLWAAVHAMQAKPANIAPFLPVSIPAKPANETGNTGNFPPNTGKTGNENRKGHSAKIADDPSLIRDDPIFDQGEGKALPLKPETIHPDCPYPETAAEKELAGHPALWAWLEAGLAWVGYGNVGYIIERLGEAPDSAALTKAKQLWSLSKNKPGNAVGILDWYDELVLNPNWTPKPKFTAAPKAQAAGGQTQAEIIKAALGVD